MPSPTPTAQPLRYCFFDAHDGGRIYMSASLRLVVEDPSLTVSVQVIGNIRTVRGFGMEHREVDEYASMTAECRSLYSQLCRPWILDPVQYPLDLATACSPRNRSVHGRLPPLCERHRPWRHLRRGRAHGSVRLLGSGALRVLTLKYMCRGALTPGDLMRFLVSSQTIQRALSQTSVLFGQVRSPSPSATMAGVKPSCRWCVA